MSQSIMKYLEKNIKCRVSNKYCKLPILYSGNMHLGNLRRIIRSKETITNEEGRENKRNSEKVTMRKKERDARRGRRT